MDLTLRSSDIKRVFAVKASLACSGGKINAKALASHGRLDVVARAILAALSLRAGTRLDTVFYATLEGLPHPPITIEVRGWELKHPIGSEEDIGNLLSRLFLGHHIEGVDAWEMSFKELVSELVNSFGSKQVIYLHEAGEDISNLSLEGKIAVLLGDHKGIDRKTETWIKFLGIRWFSLSPQPYFTEHCISFINYLLDEGIRLLKRF
ncbi:MAG: hypothetical protein QXY49_06115 [Thermofilaceae archaeon]